MSPRLLTGLCLSALLVSALLAAPEAGKKLAVVVGVNEYERDLPALSFAENDAEGMDEEATKAGFKVTLLTTRLGKRDAARMPTAENVRKAIASLTRGRAKGDTVMVCLAGHGVQLKIDDPEGKEESRAYHYFCPSDFSRSGVRFSTGLGPKVVSLDWLLRQLEDCDAERKLVLVDACRNLDKAKVTGRRYIDADRVTVPRNVCAMFSCSTGQVAYEIDGLGGRGHGAFFHFVLEGLRGKAKNVRGEVSWGSLTEYVMANVEKKVWEAAKKKQAPHLFTNFVGTIPVLVAVPPRPERPEDDGKHITNSLGMRLARAPAGEFLMGSPAGEKDRSEDEKQHRVRITKPFYLGVHEVTQGQFKAVMGYNPSHFSADGRKRDAGTKYFELLGLPAGGKAAVAGLDTSDFPVELVSWEEAVEFCRKLTAKEAKLGRHYRLPTEAEWEYACRAGTTTPFHFGVSLNGSQANCDGGWPYGTKATGPYLRRTAKVGSYGRNPFGLYDMHGNVSEWCADWAGKYRSATGPSNDPTGPSEGKSRVVRGGGCASFGYECRSAARNSCDPSLRYPFTGFRVALAVPEK